MAFENSVSLILCESFMKSIFIKDNTPEDFNLKEEIDTARIRVLNGTGINLERQEVERLFNAFERNGTRSKRSKDKSLCLPL